MKLLQFITLLLFIIMSAACKSTECQEAAKENCICTFQYDPVCGCDGKTYGNACEAGCKGITKYEKGVCPE